MRAGIPPRLLSLTLAVRNRGILATSPTHREMTEATLALPLIVYGRITAKVDVHQHSPQPMLSPHAVEPGRKGVGVTARVAVGRVDLDLLARHDGRLLSRHGWGLATRNTLAAGNRVTDRPHRLAASTRRPRHPNRLTSRRDLCHLGSVPMPEDPTTSTGLGCHPTDDGCNQEALPHERKPLGGEKRPDSPSTRTVNQHRGYIASGFHTYGAILRAAFNARSIRQATTFTDSSCSAAISDRLIGPSIPMP